MEGAGNDVDPENASIDGKNCSKCNEKEHQYTGTILCVTKGSHLNKRLQVMPRNDVLYQWLF